MKALVGAFNQEKALVGAFSVITNLRMELFEALSVILLISYVCGGCLWSMLMGKERAHMVLEMVSTVASLSTGEIPSASSVGLPQPEICMKHVTFVTLYYTVLYCTVLYCTCMSRWNQVEFHSEYEGRQIGRTRSGQG